jgi:2-phospho-L-lactate guanylyltransferase
VIAVAAIPVRDFATAKQRLAGVLVPEERGALARAMLEDVLGAVCAAPVRMVYVVSGDPDVRAVAARFPVSILDEDVLRGHSEAVALAQAVAARAGADTFVTIPGDVPGVTADELSAMLEASHGERAAVFVPSLAGYGTNAALLRPPDLMPLKFGEPSFANHLVAARDRDLAPVALSLPGLGLDIDTPDDLRALLDRSGTTRSGRLLALWRVRERFPA